MQSFTLQRDAETEDEIWLLQHPPTFTLGRNGDESHILNTAQIKQHNIAIEKIDRGGQVTYHGPGQLIIYFLLDIRRLNLGVRALVSCMENLLIDFLNSIQIKAFAKKDAPGVYTHQGKIAALGLRVKKGYCYHGLSFNINMNIKPFHYINPCGYQGLAISQLSDYLPHLTLNFCSEQLSTLISTNHQLNKNK